MIAKLHRFLEILIFDHVLLKANRILDLALKLPDRIRECFLLKAHFAAGLVDDIYRLVGQITIRDILRGKLHRRNDRLVHDAGLVVLLVFVLEAAQDTDGIVVRGRLHHDALEAPLQRAVFLDVLAVLIKRGRADALHLAAAERGLEHVRCVDRALGGAGTHEGMQLVDEDDHILTLRDLLHDGLEARLELAAVFRAGDERAQVERHHPLAGQNLGHFLGDDHLGQALDDGRLAHARLANENRVVLRAACKNLDDAFNFIAPADHRIKLVLLGKLGQIAAELIERRGLALVTRARGDRLAKQVDRLLARLLELDAEAAEYLRRKTVLLADDAKQKMLGADIVMAHQPGLFDGIFKNFFRLGGKRNISLDRPARALGQISFQLQAQLLRIDAQFLKNRDRDAAAILQHAQQNMFGAQIFVPIIIRFLSSEDNDLTGALRETFKHSALLASSCYAASILPSTITA